MIKRFFLISTLLMGGCSSSLTTHRTDRDPYFEEIKTEIADLRHALHATEMELKILDEKFENRDQKQHSFAKNDGANLQQKVQQIEKSIEKMSADLRSLMAYATQTTTSLSAYRDRIAELDKRLEEIGKLRTALSQISSPSENKSYQVKPGDSLEKIAKKFHISVENLKQANHLHSDKIIIGQELVIPAP